MCGLKNQASKIIFSNNFTFSRYELFSCFNTYNTLLGIYLPCGLQKNLHWGIPQNSWLQAWAREAGQLADCNLKFLFSPSGLNLLKICKTFLTFYYRSADFYICLSLGTEAAVFAGFQKGFQSYLTIQTSRQQKAGALTQVAKAMNLNGLFQ